MDNYSYLKGVMDGVKELVSHCESEDLEGVYDSLSNKFPTYYKNNVNNQLRRGVIHLFSTVADKVAPGVIKKDYFSRLELDDSIGSILKGCSGIKLVNKGLELGELLLETYQLEIVDNTSYIEGLDDLYIVFDKITSNGLSIMGGLLSSNLNRLLSILNKGKDKVLGLKESFAKTA
ncbi:hypothetical protein GF352_01105 [archaeon]|nr:hypothetical protein [archaeon]